MVSDSMHEARIEQESRDSDQVQEYFNALERLLSDVFVAADKDETGDLTRTEQQQLTGNPMHPLSPCRVTIRGPVPVRTARLALLPPPPTNRSSHDRCIPASL